MMDSKFSSMEFSANSSLGGLLQGAHGADVCVDTILRLDSLGSSVSPLLISKGIKRKWVCIDGNKGQQTKSSLVLGGGHCSSSSSESKACSTTVCTTINRIEEQSSVDLDLEFSLQFGKEISYSSKKADDVNIEPPSTEVEVDLELSLSTGPMESDITSVHGGSHVMQIDTVEPLGVLGTRLNDESSLSLGKTDNFLPPFHAPKIQESGFLFKPVSQKNDSTSFGSVLSASTTASPKSSFTCTFGLIHPQRVSSSKLCKFTGCSKGARGASGLCIAHGGGRRCQRPGCDKGAEGKTAFCKAHGGGRRCQFLGCTKSAEGHTEYCIAHGGGRRCGQEGCTKASRGKSGLCIRHGGGKRCQREKCTRSAEGHSGLCISHGGGRRCQYPTCSKGAQGSTVFCKAHGGGKRCTVQGCTKGAEGSTSFCKGHGGGKRCSFHDCTKSVHGGTSFCVAHGGGKRCGSLGCTKSARGRTEFCVRHGGGKRCKFERCNKSAQGSTDFCKVHGGGGKRRARLCSGHGALVQDKRIHGGITLGPLLQAPNSTRGIRTEFEGDTNADYVRPHCGEATAAGWSAFDMITSMGKGASASPVSEGRVHGGSLLAMLTCGSGK